MKKQRKYKAQLGKNVFGDNNWKSFDSQQTPTVPVNDPLARLQIDPSQQKMIPPVQGMEKTDHWYEGAYMYHPAFQAFNILAQLTTGLANGVTDAKNTREERLQFLKALQPESYENFNENGLNSNPIYMKTGGGITKDQAYAILNRGEVKGHPLTRQQKILFERIAKTGKMPPPNSIKQMGGNTNPVIEAESGEVYQNTDGQIVKIPDSQPMHEDGGVDIGNAERVLENTSDLRKDTTSKKLKLDKHLVALLTGYDASKDMSHSAALEHAKKNIEKQTGSIEQKIKGNVETLQRNLNDRYANNSLKFNMTQLKQIPTEGEVFDTLFQHQELLKGMHGIDNGTAKYGGKYCMQTGGVIPYRGGKTKQGRYTPTGVDNKFSFEGGLDAYKKAWNPFIDLNQFNTASDAQGAVYDYLLKNAPDAVSSMWKTYGNTAQGLKNKVLTDRYANGNFSTATLTPEDLQSLRGAYVDNMFGVRTMTPQTLNLQPPSQETPTPPSQHLPAAFALHTNPKSRFFEPLNWFDVAGPIANLLEGRIPAKYNPVELNQIRLKLQNPLPSLQAGQRDYNAALQMLPDNGQGYANVSNMFAQKYNVDNQILGQYENINSQIKNQETMYNANVKDRQSGANQQARAIFEQQYLGSKEAQRQQHAIALDELYTRMAQNRKLNREGNLIMQMTPAFDQYAQFNGYTSPFRMPLQTPLNPLPQTVTESKPDDKKTYFVPLSNGTKIPFKLK